ncbi:hypothetical protein WNZ15_03110 [Roseibium sp. AS2]|uniref:hypothetical protein n=1 Tax=Roseibium sp. AS2 TaxID=3135781 RepID=UPI00316C228E
MDRINLRLVHDSSTELLERNSNEPYEFKNAKQLSLFQDDERVCLSFVAMNEIDQFGFKNLLHVSKPDTIMDMRRYPDFFGFYKSTQFALEYFQCLQINYIHLPFSRKIAADSKELWNLRSNFLNGLNEAKTQLDPFGKMSLLLVASREDEIKYSQTLRSLPRFDDFWRIGSFGPQN